MYGQIIKNLREENGLSQTELAKLLNVTQKAISKYELELRDLSTDMIIKICQKFSISADYLLGLENEIGTKIKNTVIYNHSIHNGDNKL